MKEYSPIPSDYWKGRIDSEDNFDAFRWHQWVQTIDLRAIRKIDLNHNFGIAFLGFCSDVGVKRNKGRIGAENSPESIRRELMNRPCSFDQGLKLYDAGNIHPIGDDLESAQATLSNAINLILELGLFPIVLGGGHEVALGHFHGLHHHMIKRNNQSELGIINFDAHFDLRPYPNGGSSGTMFRQIADYSLEHNYPFHYLCVGIQKSGNTVDLFKTAHQLGVDYMLAKDIDGADIWGILERLDHFIKKNDAIYLTLCADVISSSYAPGVSAPQPLGLHPEKVLKLIKHIIKSGKLKSFDIAEVSPRFDHDQVTSSLASVIIYTIVTTLAEENNLSALYE
ncbi:MAG: formimidoylglutamase [Clostridiales bacterium]|nr:formimidoylglutamase [Clostridiales bacterium]